MYDAESESPNDQYFPPAHDVDWATYPGTPSGTAGPGTWGRAVSDSSRLVQPPGADLPTPAPPTTIPGDNQGAGVGIALPAPPSSVAEAGLDVTFLQELTLKHVAAGGILTGGELAQRLRLPLTGVVEEVVLTLRRDGFLDLVGGGSAVLGMTGLRLKATERGQERARASIARNGYLGPAPVALGTLQVVLRQHAARAYSVERAGVQQAVAHLSLAEATVDRLGAGLESGGPILLYGHAGNGKTALAASIAWMLSGGTLIPYAVEVDGYLLRVFDPDVHEPMPLPAGHAASELDARWVYCQRPFVRAGAEVQPSALDLQFNEQQHEYDCPLQLKASGGVLLIDDLGAQRCPIGDLLGRCLEPLASGTDSLTALGGRRIPVPFTTLLVLATSHDPATRLAEEHLRRLPCKIELPDPTPAAFRELVLRVCADAGVAAEGGGLDYLMERCYIRAKRPLRAAHAAELVRLVAATARYLQLPPQLAPELIDVAADLYFLSALEDS